MGADKTRLNGFKPSYYRCYTRTQKRACSAANTSDIVVGSFVFNFVSNLIGISNDRRKICNAGIEEVERRLLSGDPFADIAAIDSGSLRQIFDALRGVSRSASSYIPAPLPQSKEKGASIAAKRKETDKITRAMERLKKAYLFDDEAMDEREYLTTRASLEEDLTRLNNEIADAEEAAFNDVSELSFVQSASEFLLSYKIQSGEPIVYSDFAPIVGNETLKKFVNVIIEKIEIKNGRVASILFKNGLEARFIYKV